MATRVRCAIRPRALRVRVLSGSPRDRPGNSAAQTRTRLGNAQAIGLIPLRANGHLGPYTSHVSDQPEQVVIHSGPSAPHA
jgi:hypothetical protein